MQELALNWYFAAEWLSACRRGGAEGLLDFGHVSGHVDGDAGIGAFGDADMVAIFEPAKLLELFQAFEIAGRERGKFQESGAAKRVDADMLGMARGDALARVANPWNGSAGEIKGVAVEIRDDLHDVGVHDFRGVRDGRAERGDLRFRDGENFVHDGVDGFR